jgi:hypothetical protein
MPTERPALVGEVSANFSGLRVSRGQRNEIMEDLQWKYIGRDISFKTYFGFMENMERKPEHKEKSK